MKKIYFAQKRALDLIVGIFLLVATLPIQFIVASLIWLKMGRPIFFVQTRSGLNGRVFNLVKFRSMTTENASDGNDINRITQLGNFIRKTSLDELPSLWNVLKGDMSLVGPRPLLERYWNRYSPAQRRRHEVKPGLTGWAQINGRNRVTWEEKFALDVWYVDHCNIWFDIRILFKTLGKVVWRENISAGEDVTMSEFRGQ